MRYSINNNGSSLYSILFYSAYRMGNSFVPLGPTSVALAAITKVAGEGFCSSSVVTSSRWTSLSQFSTLSSTLAAL